MHNIDLFLDVNHVYSALFIKNFVQKIILMQYFALSNNPIKNCYVIEYIPAFLTRNIEF